MGTTPAARGETVVVRSAFDPLDSGTAGPGRVARSSGTRGGPGV